MAECNKSSSGQARPKSISESQSSIQLGQLSWRAAVGDQLWGLYQHRASGSAGARQGEVWG